ncbi:MAG: hypothetical protein CR986_03765 [Ignavibacteriae bacterium]|nr:MAG: hypothetical protein CR986_03765 [Ignavibacteriota bacterium]
MKKPLLLKYKKEIIYSLLFILISGCGVWTNFKTYFNTYYNANRIFEETETQILANRKELFYFEEPVIPQNLSEDLDEVIEKTSSIMQHHKESDFVDDAILMTGKSFYYQQNFSRALRKFKELATIKNSEFILENKYWMGKTMLQMREFTKALRLLNEVKKEAQANDQNQILTETYKTIIGYYLYVEKYDEVLNEIKEFLKTDIDNELRAEVLYETGLLYEKTKKYKAAQNTFALVPDYNPTFLIDFRSRFESAKLTKELGDTTKSLELFNELRNEDKFIDFMGEIELEIGKIYYDRKNINNALEKFTVVDTTYPKTPEAGKAEFYRAEIIENYVNNYDSALVLYQEAAYSLAPMTLRTIAKNKSGQLRKYIDLHDKLDNLQIQYLYLTNEDVFIKDSLDFVKKVKQDSIKAAEENLRNNERLNKQARRGGRRQEQFNNATQTEYLNGPKRPTITVDSIKALNSKYYFRLANLLFTEFDDPDSAFYYYNLSLSETKNNPNEAQILYSIGDYYLAKKEKEKADSMFTVVYNKFEFDPIRNEAAKQIGKPLYDFDKDPIEDEYIEAEELYYSSSYNEAIKRLFEIYKENPKSIYASKSLYTIGFILENNLNMPDSAAIYYNLLKQEYSSSEYAKNISIKVTAYNQEQIRLQAVQDSIRKAEEERIKATSLQDSLATTITDSTNIELKDSTNFFDKEPKAIEDTLNSEKELLK